MKPSPERCFGMNLLTVDLLELDLQTLIFTTRTMFFESILVTILQHAALYSDQAPVVQRLDNAIHWINRYPVDKC